ncbi:DUF1127 domain-containing protein [Devosia sp. ZB163]|uniref:DUF1127 domain-containing protein n=1 Tax=Devosia sp. ZB163 TaxID=3025938 RepID=UPI002362E5B3|nr:DUF1127 domain-containing protein [Devosia sp. ZB163]MDC9822248.1 DUF1127 domain-containing protein [Devosia sp. ZB163]
MSTIEINDTLIHVGRPTRTGWFRRWLEKRRVRQLQRITLGELEQMNPHLLRDMGIEPRDVIDALEGRQSSLLFNPMRREE